MDFVNSESRLLRDKKLVHKVLDVYGCEKTSRDLRIFLEEYLAACQWDEIDPDSFVTAKAMYDKIQEILEMKLMCLSQDMSWQSRIVEANVKDVSGIIKTQYELDPCRLVKMLKDCYLKEKDIVDRYQEMGALALEEDAKQEMFSVALHVWGELQQKVKDIGIRLRILDQKQQTAVTKLGQMQSSLSAPENRHQVNNLQLLRSNIHNEGNSLLAERESLLEEFKTLLSEVKNQHDNVLGEIRSWKEKQRLEPTGLALLPEGMLQSLNQVCEVCGSVLIQFKQELERFVLLWQNTHGQLQVTNLLLGPAELLNDMEEMLRIHITNVIVIEKQPISVMKITKQKSQPFQLAVRILGGRSLSLDNSSTRLLAGVVKEDNMRKRDYSTVGEIVNFKEKILEYDSKVGMVGASATSVELRDMPRNNKNARDENVTDFLYGIKFSLNINVGGRNYTPVVYSHPFVLTSQTSQSVMAWPVIYWYMAFTKQGPEDELPYTVPDRMPWGKVASLLNALFIKNTGRGLHEDQLIYLGKRAMGTDDTKDIMRREISKEVLYKRKMAQYGFPFWRWFYACLNLMKEHLKKEWTSGKIHGFMSKARANALLKDKEPGTFLLRLSESDIDTHNQSQSQAGMLTVAVVDADPATGKNRVYHVKEHLKPDELAQSGGLAPVLEAMEVKCHDRPQEKKPLLTTLCENVWIGQPAKPFEEVFKGDIVKKNTPGEGYTAAKFKIEILLANGGGTGRMPPSPAISEMSVKSPATPFSQNPDTPFSPFTPDPSSPETADEEPGSHVPVNVGSDDVKNDVIDMEETYGRGEPTNWTLEDVLRQLDLNPGTWRVHLNNDGQLVAINEGQPMPQVPLTVTQHPDNIDNSSIIVQNNPSGGLDPNFITSLQTE